MNIKYSKIRLLAEKESIESHLEIMIEERNRSLQIKGFLNLEVKYNDDFDIASKQIWKYAKFESHYFILNVKNTTYKTHFGLTKIKGRMLYLLNKEDHDRLTNNSSLNDNLLYNRLVGDASHSHIGFIADNFKRFVI